jgi:hypothetical protein
MAKNYFKSYIWLLETLQSHGHLTLKELQSLWMRSSVNDEYKELAPRTLSNHIQSILDVFGIEISCDRSDNTYFIENEDEIGGGSIRNWMLEALSLNSLLNESAGMKDRIIFENVPSSQKHLTTVIQAMRNNKVLDVIYKSYQKQEEEQLTLEPYCIREFKNRWYLYAHKAGIEGPHMYALDRMLSAEVGEKSFKMPSKFSPSDFFSGVYGVRVYPDMKPETVILKAASMQANYFRSLPLHSSQEEIECTEEYSIFEYFLTPDYDFKQDVLSFGTRVEVMEPGHLREELGEIVRDLADRYSK